MANSVMQLVSDGSLSTIPLTIKFFEQAHIKVFVNNSELPNSTYTFTWSGATTITITPAVASGIEVSIRRKTPASEVIHNFQAGAVFNEQSIDENFQQELFLLQEASEQSLVTDLYTDLNMHGKRITNLAEGINPNDAVTLAQAQQFADGGQALALRAELGAPTGVDLVGGAASDYELNIERARINILEFARHEQYSRATKIASAIRDALYNSTTLAFIISLFGDSTMWGSIPFNTTTQDPKHPGVALKQALDLIYPGNSVTVVNGARPATTLKQLLNGTDGGIGTYADRLAASPNTTIVFCNHCLNDCGSYESTLPQYRDNLVVWVNTTRAYGKIPVLVTPSLISPIQDGREDQMKRQPAFIQAMRDVAATMSVDLVDNFKFTEASAELYAPHDIAPDGVHLSQLFYQQAGWNMAIPLINPHVIRDVGDLAGLSTSAWADNITQSRSIWDTSPTRFSSILTGDAIAATQAVNFPVVVDKPTKDTVLAVGCALTGAGGRGQLTYFGFEGQPQFGGIIDYKAGANSDFNCLMQPLYCALPAGLSIVGVKINTAMSPAPNVNFTFAGVQLIKRVESGFGYPTNSGYQLNREVLVRDELSVYQYLASGAVLLELRQAVSPFDVLAKLHWNAVTGKVELVTVSGTTVVWDAPQPGQLNASLSLNDDRTITAKVGGLIATSAVAASAVGRAFVASATPYWLKKY